MAKDFRTVGLRARKPDPRIKGGPLRYARGQSMRDFDRLCVFNGAYLAAAEAARGGRGVLAMDAVDAQLDCTGFPGAIAKTMFEGMTRMAGVDPAEVTDEIRPLIEEITERLGAMSSGPDVAQQVFVHLAKLIFQAQELKVPKTLWGIHACALDLASPPPHFEVPEGVHHLLLRLHCRERVIEELYLPVESTVTTRGLEEQFLAAIGFRAPYARAGLVRLLLLWARFGWVSLMTLLRIWRSGAERKRKYLAFAHNLPTVFEICARNSLGKSGTLLSDRDKAEAMVRHCRAQILGTELERAPQVQPGPRRDVRGTVPVLMYHRVATDRQPALAQWSISPGLLEEQLKFLKREGFTTLTSRSFGAVARGETSLPARPVMLTFDDAYTDFYRTAFPLLERYGATAELFAVTGKVGGVADWDRAYGAPAPLMSWAELREVDRAGIVIGSHLVSHRHGTRLDDEALIQEGAVSRFTLEAKLGHSITSLALPYGDYDNRVVDAMALCGYQQIYTVDARLAAIAGDMLRIPRLNVGGNTDLSSFARMLGVITAKQMEVA